MTANEVAQPQLRRGTPGREQQRLWYWSFAYAQGDQAVQVHVIQCCARLMREQGEPLDQPAATAPLGKFRLPAGHTPVADPTQILAQAQFWWDLMRDLLNAVDLHDPTLLPNREQLEQRALRVGGTKEMSSFTDEEMAALDYAIDLYRGDASDSLTSTDVVERHLVPNLIRVELAFQGHGTRWAYRPRTDGGDPHTSRLLEYCESARRHHTAGVLTLLDRMAVQVCARLDSLATVPPGSEPVAARYRDLLEAYNTNHPSDRVARLHVPIAEFAAPTADEPRQLISAQVPPNPWPIARSASREKPPAANAPADHAARPTPKGDPHTAPTPTAIRTD